MSESFHVNISFSDPVALGKKVFKRTSILLLHLFYNYLSFEEELTLNLYNFLFPLHKDYKCKVRMLLALWFLRRRFEEKKICVFFLHYLSPLGQECSKFENVKVEETVERRATTYHSL
jgi:hypothetical protein